MTKPVRLQLSRRKGYNMQTLSKRVNGLTAARVSRPGRWGNPYPVGVTGIPTAYISVSRFRAYLAKRLQTEPGLLKPLRGKNLACWCKLGTPCHADVLLEVANRRAEMS